jgi:hypothetical protein
MVKNRIWPQLQGKMGLKFGPIYLSKAPIQITHIFNESPSKTTYSHSARRDLSIGARYFKKIKITPNFINNRNVYLTINP